MLSPVSRLETKESYESGTECNENVLSDLKLYNDELEIEDECISPRTQNNINNGNMTKNIQTTSFSTLVENDQTYMNNNL